MALPPFTADTLEFDRDPLATPNAQLPSVTWAGADIPSAPLPPFASTGIEPTMPAAVPLLAAPGSVQPQPPAMIPVETPAAVPAPISPVPMPRPSREELESRITPQPETPELERAPEAAASQAEVLAETAATQATRQADYLSGFANRLREVNERDQRARDEVMANVDRITEQLDADQDEIRALSRDAGKLSTGAKAGMLVAAGLQALKALIGAGKADPSVIDAVIQRDADAKARALQAARERAGISEERRATELGRLQELDYLRRTAVATTWDQIASDLDADASAAKDVQAQLQLATAADRARAAAIQARQDAGQAALQQEIDITKKSFELTKLGAEAQTAEQRQLAEIRKLEAEGRKAEAEAMRAERRARGGGGPGTTGLTVERQLRGLSEEERKEVEERGIRSPTGAFLTSPDGTFIRARSRERADKMADQWAGVMTVNDLLIRLEALRAKYGHEFDISNSAAVQDMKSTMGELQLKLKDVYQLGVLSDSDLQMLKEITGGDPSGWFDKRPTWAAMRSRVEGSWTRQLRQHAGYTGDFRLNKFQGAQRSLEQISTPLDRPYDPVSGKVIPTATRLAALEEERQRMVTEGGTAGGLTMATEIAIERAERRINEDHRALFARMENDLEAARAAGDQAKIRTINASMDEQRKFAAAASEWVAKQRAKLRKAGPSAEDIEKAGRMIKATGGSLKPPRFGGQRTF